MVFFVFWCAIFIVIPLHVFIVKTKKQYWSVIISEIRPYFTLCICFVNNPWRISKTSSVRQQDWEKHTNTYTHPSPEGNNSRALSSNIHTHTASKSHMKHSSDQNAVIHILSVLIEAGIVSFLTAGMCNTKADGQRNCTLATNQN